MLPEIELEALHFLDRATLEGLQMHSRFLRDLVIRQAHTLPLRNIHSAEIVNGNVCIRLLENEGGSVKVVAWRRFFLRVNNAFIHRLELDFRPENVRLLNHLRAKANDLQCQVKALYIRGEAVGIDYVLVDFLGICLKPQIYETWLWSAAGFEEDYITLFMHNALRDNVKNLSYEMFEMAERLRI